MKKHITLLASALFVTGISTAQIAKSAEIGRKMPMKMTTSKAVVGNTNTDEKAGGAIIWQSDFSNTAVWTTGNVTPGVQGAFQFGPYPVDFSDYMTATTTGLTQPMAFFNGIQYLIAPPVGIQNAFMQTETIDMSVTNIISVSFNQIYRRFNNDIVYVEVSTDNGVTWPAALSKKVNTEAVGNGPTLRNVSTTDFLIGAGVTQGKVRVRWESLDADDDYGSGYGWAIDNFKVLEGYQNNLKLVNAYSAYGTELLSATKMPLSQTAGAGKMSFAAEIENVGAVAQPTSFSVTGTAYTQTSAEVSLAPFAMDSLEIPAVSGYTIPTTVGTYNFMHRALSDNTLDFIIDDTISSGFAVTTTTYAVDTYNGPSTVTGSFNGWQNQTGNPQIGTMYQVFAADEVAAVQVGIGNVPAASQTPYIGRSVYASIYKYDAATQDFVYFDRSDDHEIVAADFGNLITCAFANVPELPVGLYLVTGGTYNTFPVPIAFSGSIAAGNTRGFNGATSTGLASDGNKVEAPVVRLQFVQPASLSELTSVSEVNVFPNPFVGTTEMKFNLKADNKVSVVITDVAGRTVATVPATQMNAGEQTISIDGTNFVAGIYNYTLTVGNETITKRIVKK